MWAHEAANCGRRCHWRQRLASPCLRHILVQCLYLQEWQCCLTSAAAVLSHQSHADSSYSCLSAAHTSLLQRHKCQYCKQIKYPHLEQIPRHKHRNSRNRGQCRHDQMHQLELLMAQRWENRCRRCSLRCRRPHLQYTHSGVLGLPQPSQWSHAHTPTRFHMAHPETSRRQLDGPSSGHVHIRPRTPSRSMYHYLSPPPPH